MFWKNQELLFRKKYDIDKSFRFNGINIKLYGEGEIICMDNSYIGEYSTIQSSKNCKVCIGKNTSISHNVRIYTSTAISDQDFNFHKRKKFGDVVIGDGVWIGANVLINPGITIGENSIIGANSVLTKNVDPHTIVGGVPAKLIRIKKNFERKT